MDHFAYLRITLDVLHIAFSFNLFSGQFPNKLPAHLTKPKQRVIVNPRYSQERVNLQRPDAVSNEKCDICNVHLTPDTVEEHRSSELHILRVTYRQNRCI